MISYRLIFLMMLIAFGIRAQSLTDAQQKAINNTVTYINHLTDQVNTIAPSLIHSYSQMMDYKRKPSQFISPYTCKTDARPFYYDQVLKSMPALGSAGKELGLKTAGVRKAYQQIDSTCKAIEIYYRLKDYQLDQFKTFEELIKILEEQLNVYAQQVHIVQQEGYTVMAKIQPYTASSTYQRADKLMRDQLVLEKSLIDAWRLNLFESVHSGWPVAAVQNHLRESEKQIPVLREIFGIQYPASAMVKSFAGGVESLQQVKRSGIDGYTYEKQRSDEHSNSVYNSLITYYNNDCVSFYNSFISQSIPNGYRGIYYMKTVIRFSVQTTAKKINLEVQPYMDKSVAALKVTPVASSVTPAIYTSLDNYTTFINEGI